MLSTLKSFSAAPFCELSELTSPVWFWDSAQGAILWANSPGISYWGERDLLRLRERRFDCAMPGIQSLRQLHQQEIPADGLIKSFRFWTDRGTREEKCHCQRLTVDGSLNGLLLTLIEGHDQEPLAVPRFSSLDDLFAEKAQESRPQNYSDQETLEEIARLIRKEHSPPHPFADQNQRAENFSRTETDGRNAEFPSRKSPGKSFYGLKDKDRGFIATVSHEMRTPLSSIIGFTELMKEEQFGPIGHNKYKGYVEDIYISAQHALSLVNDVLEISKIQAGTVVCELSPLDANPIIRQTMSTLEPLVKKARILMRTSLLSGTGSILAEERSLRQILLNLLSNALKFTEPGGQIIVSTFRAPPDHFTIRIQDTGIGMSPEEVEVAPEPFRQLTPALDGQTGTGLGLTIAKALAAANNAQLIITSERKKGTRADLIYKTPPVS